MVKSGITRRIDELGRLVIPKEIRKNLKIKDNDQIEISIVNDKIVLSKYDVLKKDNVIHELILCLKKVLNTNVLFTTRDKIVDYVLLKSEILEENLDSEITKVIENRKETISNNKIISPIIINGDLYGSLIIYGDNIHNADERVFHFAKIFLENYLE